MKSANLHNAFDATTKNPWSSQEIMTLPQQKQIIKFIRKSPLTPKQINRALQNRAPSMPQKNCKPLLGEHF